VTHRYKHNVRIDVERAGSVDLLVLRQDSNKDKATAAEELRAQIVSLLRQAGMVMEEDIDVKTEDGFDK
jgi:hypothetical protein